MEGEEGGERKRRTATGSAVNVMDAQLEAKVKAEVVDFLMQTLKREAKSAAELEVQYRCAQLLLRLRGEQGITEEYVKGYEDGYRDGRNPKTAAEPTATHTTPNQARTPPS